MLFEDAIAVPNEIDAFQVDLIGGVDYVAAVLGASTAGGVLPDPAVAVFDGAGNQVAFSDDSLALGLDPMAQFTAPTSGTYTVAVADLSGGTGDYTLVVDQAGVPISFGTPPGHHGDDPFSPPPVPPVG
jgi:hypothetical protein